MSDISVGVDRPIHVERWPSELPLRILLLLAALAGWAFLIVSIIGIIYGALIALVVFIAHVGFIAHLRGSAVRLGPDQLPELHERVQLLARRIGMEKAPAAYVMQAGGMLNAFATKFLGSNFIVLYSELLEACGDNTEARDFIIAHELGHIHAGHLRLHWLLLPGAFVPFLGSAYSRACEFTCDRYGLAASDDNEKALDGLCILAAGGKHGPKINRRALAAQRADVDTVWMKIGQWLSTHPVIAHRLEALQPSLATARLNGSRSSLGAVLLLASLVIVPSIVVAAVVGTGVVAMVRAEMQKAQGASASAGVTAAGEADAVQQTGDAISGLQSMAAAIDSAKEAGLAIPSTGQELYDLWRTLHPGEEAPIDPFDGQEFGYMSEDGEYYLWSIGPSSDTEEDDIYIASDGW